MKKLVALAALIVSTLSASAFADTKVIVTPARPANCIERDYSTVNWIYYLTKTEETSKSATFQFVTEYGSCVDMKYNPNYIQNNAVYISIIADTIHLPWRKEVVEYEYEAISPTMVKVKMKFDTKRIFKKHTSENFEMIFHPGGDRDLHFGWYLDLYQDEDNGTSLKINVSK